MKVDYAKQTEEWLQQKFPKIHKFNQTKIAKRLSLWGAICGIIAFIIVV